MRVFVVALALSAVLSAAPSFAQALPPPAAAPAAQKPPAPAPQTQKPAPAPAAAAPAVPTPKFQDGMKYAFVYLDQLAGFSSAGKTLSAKVQALNEQKLKELQDRNKALLAAQEKLEKGASVMNETARAQLATDIERQQRDLQRASEDAQQEVNGLAQQLQQEFFRVVLPVIERVAKAKQVHFVFNAQESGLLWAEPTMDLTAEVIRELDTAATAKPAAAPPVQVPVKP
jgi:outer membrane protein